MKINWIFADNQAVTKETKALIDKEFELRTELSKLFLKDTILSTCEDFDGMTFNYDINSGRLQVSSNTPEPYYSRLKRLLKKRNNEIYNSFGDLKVG